MSLPADHQCCTLPPVSAEYTPKGTYTQLSGLKTYEVGPTDTGKAILMVYDVFGFSPQILQAADILGSAGFRVAMPDFLHGKYATADMFDGSAEGKKKFQDYFGSFPGAADSQSEQIGNALKALHEQGYKSVGTVGYCWGWKATTLSKGVNDFAAIASCHPSFIDAEDADRVNIPCCLLPSEGEDKKVTDGVYAALEKKNPGKNFIKWYSDMPHGFAAARGDLSGGRPTEAYQDAYAQLIKFFKAHV